MANCTKFTRKKCGLLVIVTNPGAWAVRARPKMRIAPVSGGDPQKRERKEEKISSGGCEGT